jgi:hypothetical protein
MLRIFPGRHTANIEEPFVVSLIGMRINQLWALHRWIPVARSMGPMISELSQNPDKGFLSAHLWIGWREVMLVQYWKSFDALEAYARSASDSHLPAWKAFNKNVGADGSVGIWHETYLVGAKQYECLYANMPRFGLANAGEHVAAVGNRETARLRMGGTNQPAVPSPSNPD